MHLVEILDRNYMLGRPDLLEKAPHFNAKLSLADGLVVLCCLLSLVKESKRLLSLIKGPLVPYHAHLIMV